MSCNKYKQHKTCGAQERKMQEMRMKKHRDETIQAIVHVSFAQYIYWNSANYTDGTLNGGKRKERWMRYSANSIIKAGSYLGGKNWSGT